MTPLAQERRPLRRLLALALLTGLLGAATARAGGAPLSKQHKKWLEEEVVYIISNDEKKTFLSLTSDEEREKFIQQFWEVRDPTPGTPENEYKEEHYRRIDYSKRYFGIGSGSEGWRTDRGRIYIQLGEPAQRMKWNWEGRLRPAELWFYSNTENPSLPNFFYVLFYQRDEIGDERLYSPFMDGPTKLVRGADTNARAYQLLHQISPELARASLSLLTDEPIDIDNFSPSLASDAMLTRIYNLPNDRFTKEKLDRRTQLRAMVQTRLFAEPEAMEVLWVPFRHPDGQTYVHFLLTLPKKLEELAGEDKEKNQHYVSTQVNVLVRTPDGHQLFQQGHTNLFTFSTAQFEAERSLAVVYVDRLPLPPGDYDIDFVFYDGVHQTYSLARQTMKVPATPPALALGPLVPYDEALRVQRSDVDSPFAFFDIRFLPSTRREFGRGENLSVLFQIYLPPNDVHTRSGEKLQMDYTLGTPASGGSRQSVYDQVDINQFDTYGTVLHGKVLPLGDLAPGNYRLAVKVTDPTTNHNAAQTFSFRVVPAPPETKRVTLYNDQARKDLPAGWLDYRRGVCLAALNQLDPAIESFQTALRRNPGFQLARDRLASAYFLQQRYDQVVGALEPLSITGQTDRDTLALYLTSLEKLGQFTKAIAVGERALSVLGPTEDLYEQLASLYDRSGQVAQARQAREEASRLHNTQTKSEDK